MVFADIEYSGVADELAAKARAGEFEVHDETEAPKTARLISETSPSEGSPKDEPEDMDLESEAHFEILTLDEGNSGLQIMSAGLVGERNQEEPSIPGGGEEGAGILIADPIGSATMDEHIQATIAEDADDPEALVALVVPEPESDIVPTDSGAEVVSHDDPGTSSTIDITQNSPHLLLDVDDSSESNAESEVVVAPGPADSSDPADVKTESALQNPNSPEAQIVSL